MSDNYEFRLPAWKERYIKIGTPLFGFGILGMSASPDVSVLNGHAAELLAAGASIPTLIGAVCLYKGLSGWHNFFGDDPEPEDNIDYSEVVVQLSFNHEMIEGELAA